MYEFIPVAIFLFVVIAVAIKLGVFDKVLFSAAKNRSVAGKKGVAFAFTVLFVGIIMGVGMLATVI